MAAFKIALSAGHGKNTAGKRCLKALDPKQTREWVLNSRIADKIEQLLGQYTGWELKRLDDVTGAKDVALATRSKAANTWGADFYLALHHNAGVKGGKGGGIVAYVYTSPSAASVEWQKALYNALIEETGLKGNRSKPLAKKNLHECREPKMPAVLLELGFMDSAADVPVILSEAYANKCAKAIVEVLVEKGNLAKKPEPAAGSAPAPSAAGVTPYKVRINTDVLRVRKGPGTSHDIVTKVTRGDVFTIVDERNGWGLLKSYAEHRNGWISLAYTNKIATSQQVKVGSKVKLKKGAKTFTGNSLASFVYSRVHTVTQLAGDRAVIAYNGVTVAAVNKADLVLAE